MAGATKSGMLAVDANSYRPLLDGVKSLVAKYEQRVSTFKGYVDKPGGTYWEGQTATAGQSNAADGWKTIARIQDLGDKYHQSAGPLVDYTILPALINGQIMIHNAERQPGVTVNEDLSMTYTAPEEMSKEQAEKNAKTVADAAKELKASGDKWWDGDQQVKHLTESVARDIENEVNSAAGTFDIGKAVKDTAPRKPDTPQDANFYKDWYPKKTDPASIDPGAGTLGDKLEHIKNPATTPTAATAAVDPNAPQYGPFAKDTIDRTKLGGIGESLTYINRNDKPPEEHKPSAAERFKTDISHGIDKGVDKLVAPFTDLRDRLGLGDKGFWEANEEAGKREWESFKHQMTTPPIVDIAEGVKHNIENPGQYVGEKLVDGGAILAGGPVGPEAALPRIGLEESSAARLGMHPDLPSPGALHDTPAPAHTAEPPSGATHHDPTPTHVEHDTGGVDHHNFDVTPDTSHDLYHSDSGTPEPRPYNNDIQPYPHAYHPGTGDEMPFPPGDLDRISKDDRFEWTNMDRYYYIKQWHDMGYETPPGGWNLYDIHHIKPREFGGDNSFENLIPVPRSLHNQSITPWWRNFG
ncbi:HNH endonuclease signature motif containing protein [Mycobacteroides abscessus]|uniref:HNH endonuclease signature motif containing protein n=1 Tax=Mycobacteroides abscessus TaxID=36809 RepID=UPI0011C3F148|nr:HNH endonuclease signature motif containing protein [Mycobacteroides abscessus]